jgi:hypothetical protein
VANAQARSLANLVNNAAAAHGRAGGTATNKAGCTRWRDAHRPAPGLWKEIYAGQPVDAYRRRLQALYLEAMASKIKPPAPVRRRPAAGCWPAAAALVNTRDFRPLLKDEMRIARPELAAAIGRTSDRASRAHLQDARDQISRCRLERRAPERGDGWDRQPRAHVARAGDHAAQHAVQHRVSRPRLGRPGPRGAKLPEDLRLARAGGAQPRGEGDQVPHGGQPLAASHGLAR